MLVQVMGDMGSLAKPMIEHGKVMVSGDVGKKFRAGTGLGGQNGVREQTPETPMFGSGDKGDMNEKPQQHATSRIAFSRLPRQTSQVPSVRHDAGKAGVSVRVVQVIGQNSYIWSEYVP